MLALVLVNALDVHVEQRIGIDPHAGALLDLGGQRRLVGALNLPPRFAERAVVGERLEARQLLFRVANPRVADGFGDQAA